MKACDERAPHKAYGSYKRSSCPGAPPTKYITHWQLEGVSPPFEEKLGFVPKSNST